MLIKFNELQETSISNFYGGEKDTIAKMFTDELKNRIMLCKLEIGASIGRHTHENGSEIVYVLRGNGKALYDDGEEKLEVGVCHYCPKGHCHGIINNGGEELLLFTVVVEQ